MLLFAKAPSNALMMKRDEDIAVRRGREAAEFVAATAKTATQARHDAALKTSRDAR